MIFTHYSLATKKDYWIASMIGGGFSLLIIPILENIKPGFWVLSLNNVFLLFISFVILANIALFIGSILGSAFHFFWQFTKFSAVGSLNAVLDFGLFNLLSFIFKVYSGPMLAVFNIFSVAIAMTNSYLMNKFWSFQSQGPVTKKEFTRFFFVSLITISVNTLVVYLLTTSVSAPGGLSKEVWENIAKLVAVPVTLIFNFCGYKFIVFKEDNAHE
ncbi:MAG: hypothetical protein A3I24_04605 [Candidatus Harrisonbacteria bacterium RIFCSPLOWO2_02_FULL_41_13b]|uniref:GtrA/DPMS transmembrane domain-containing protein n=1 Tax=Candidatus Harrisonbacteria bacterium RIFCSPLOWO2_02_FULL_41_13b TaxID=1798409 RepID=A0A1G1ZQ07_9BACT|nr:MAG: hypothetical protein A3I24_04605 [Candidatus Harrisonbacteria bacterium RIFCSPLOWO2_02_FULL_41_13b]